MRSRKDNLSQPVHEMWFRRGGAMGGKGQKETKVRKK